MSIRQQQQTEPLNEEEKALRELGLEFLRIKREVEGLANTTIPNLIDHLNGLGLALQKAQEEARQRRLAEQAPDKRKTIEPEPEPEKPKEKKKKTESETDVKTENPLTT